MNLVLLICCSVIISTFFLRCSRNRLLLLKAVIFSYICLINEYSGILLLLSFLAITFHDYKQFIFSICMYYVLIKLEAVAIVSTLSEYIIYISETQIKLSCIMFIFFLIFYIFYILLFDRLYYYRYYRDVVLLIGDYVIEGKGYFDSGNMLTYKGIPVVFLSIEENKINLDDVEKVNVNVKTVNSYTEQSVYRGNLKIGTKKYSVFVGFRNEHKKYDILLNVRLGEGIL